MPTNFPPAGWPPTPSASRGGTTASGMSPLTSRSVTRHQANANANRTSLSSDEMIRELLETMKGTLGLVGQTLEVVGETTEHVAGLSPAIEMARQAGEVAKDLERHDQRQEEQMNKLKEHMKTVGKDNVDGYLATAVQEIVREEIGRQIAARVSEQLQLQVSAALKKQAREHEDTILNTKRRLHNSEARRMNAIPKIKTTEPLRALLRANGNPSGHFPENLSALLSMSATDVKRLLRDYDLEQGGNGSSRDEEEQRVLNLNKFLQYIGVGFEVLPPRSTPGNQSAVPPSPIFVQSH